MRGGDAVGGLAWAHQVHRVPAFAQPVFEALHGEGHAIHFGRVGLGDDAVAHARLRVCGSLPRPGDRGMAVQ